MINICLSGFESREKTTLIQFIEEMGDLGFKIQPGITFSVNVLVCNSSQFDKYRVAKRLNIDVVGKEWVYKCYENHALLDTAQYQLKPFRNIKLALFGFLESEYERLSDFIIKNEGVIEKEIKDAEIVVFKKGTQYEFEMKNVKKCVVDSDWIMQCYERKYFVPTQYFQYNQSKLDPRQLLADLQGSKIQEALNKISFSDFSYLEECVIYVAIKDENLKRILHQLISVGNGFYVTQILPIVTHIIYLQGCSEEIQQSGAKLVHPMWLCDCFILRRKLIEEEFQVKIKLSEHQSTLSSFGASQEDAQREQIMLGKIPETKPFMEENGSQRFGLRSSNFSTNNSNLLAFNKFSVSNVARKTKLFDLCQIFIFDHSTLDKSLFSLLSDHGALFERLSYPLKVKYSSLKISKAKQIIIFLLPDHELCKNTITTLEQDSKLENIKFFSYRWVTYCVQQSKLELQVSNKKLYQLLPTNQTTPTEDLKGKNIYVTSVEVNQKIVFRELAKIVTGIECKFSLGDLDYYVSDKQGKKYKQITEINSNIRIMNQIEIKQIDWLLSQFINQKNQI